MGDSGNRLNLRWLHARLLVSTTFTVIAVISCLLLLSCGSAPGTTSTSISTAVSQSDLQPAAAPVPIEALATALAAEFERLSIDPDKVVAGAPEGDGNTVFDLSGSIVAQGDPPKSAVKLTWTECLVGDYDQNGEVGISDLTPLGQNLGALVSYRTPDETGGISWWPTGDSLNSGGVLVGEPPLPDSGAANWRRARIDGDANGELNVSDVTPIAVHWRQRLTGYHVYRRAAGTEEFESLPCEDDPASPCTVLHPPATPHRPVILSFIDSFVLEGEYEYYVAPYDVVSDETGPISSTISIDVPANPPLSEPPVAVLNAEPTAGVAPLMVKVDASASYDPDGQIALYEWDWDGDGVFDQHSHTETTAIQSYPVRGEYALTLRVTDDSNTQGTASVMIAVNEAPQAEFTAMPTSGGPPFLVQFDATASSDADGEIVRYRWDWDNDGVYDYDAGADPLTEHVFDDNGVYGVILEVTDDAEATATAQVLVKVNEPPVAILDLIPPSGDAPLLVKLDASASYDPNGCIVEHLWDFNSDGTFDYDTGSFKWTTHEYTCGYPVATVQVTDNKGASNTASAKLKVNWAHTWGRTATVTHGKDLAVDSTGGIYLCGSIEASDTFNNDVFLGYINASLELEWLSIWATADWDTPCALSRCSDGSLVITGKVSTSSSAAGDVFLIKYTPAGQLLWGKVWDAGDREEARGMALGADDSIYLTGQTRSCGAGGYDALTMKYSADGALQWAQTWGGSENDTGEAVVADQNGGLYVVGSTRSYGVASDEVLVVKYTQDGTFEWARTWGGAQGDIAFAATVNSSDELIISGYTLTFGAGQYDALLLAYSPAGELLWSKTWGTSAKERACDVAIDDEGAILVSAIYIEEDISNDNDVVLLKCSAEGKLAWAMHWDKNAPDFDVEGLYLDSQGYAYIVGALRYSEFLRHDGGGALVDQVGVSLVPSGTAAEAVGTHSEPAKLEVDLDFMQDIHFHWPTWEAAFVIRYFID